jgi:hypothetical protein
MTHESRFVNYISTGTGGHRSDYDRVLTAELRDQNIKLLQFENARQTTDPDLPVLYSMLDTNVLAFLRTAAIRSARKRITVGLFFRPGECFLTTSPRYRIKRLLFRAASRLPHVSILTLMPFSVFPLFSDVATGWIYDPQLWDLLSLGIIEGTGTNIDLPNENLTNGKPLIIALGKQDEAKGFDYLVDLWCASASVRTTYSCIVAGKVDAKFARAASRFVHNGGILIDRHISDDELVSFYRRADIIWSCYSPSYNQASGIFGRAFQFGVPAIVRNESYLQALGRLLIHPTLALPFRSEKDAADLLLNWHPKRINLTERIQRIRKLREFSTSVLINSLSNTQLTISS